MNLKALTKLAMYGNILSRAQSHQTKETEMNVQNYKEPVTQTSLHLIFIASFNCHLFHIFKISLFLYVCAQLCPILCDPIDLACQASLSMEFSKQKYWNRLPFPSPGYLPDPGIKLVSLASLALEGKFFTTSTTTVYYFYIYYSSLSRHDKKNTIQKV